MARPLNVIFTRFSRALDEMDLVPCFSALEMRWFHVSLQTSGVYSIMFSSQISANTQQSDFIIHLRLRFLI